MPLVAQTPRAKLADAPDVLTAQEAAAILGVNAKLVYEAIGRHQLPAIRLGRLIRIPKAALARLLTDAQPEPAPTPVYGPWRGRKTR